MFLSMEMREKYLILMAGGKGRRMGGEIPKQMMEIEDVPIMKRSLDLFFDLPFEVHVIIVINPAIRQKWKEYCRRNNIVFPYYLVNGGMTRFHSVKKALKYLPDGVAVAVHDAVRPFFEKADIIRMFEYAEVNPAVIPAINITDSMRVFYDDGNSSVIDRSKYRLIQTPQIFHSEILKAAYDRAFSPEFTDDASVVEAAGVPLFFCEGKRNNIKITTPEDMEMASAIIKLMKLKELSELHDNEQNEPDGLGEGF